MKIYLVQHALALPKEENPARPLSARGIADAERVGRFVSGGGLRVERVLHSGKERAEQTARILAATLGIEDRVQQTDGLNPNDPVERFADTLGGMSGDSLIVGHLPFMGRLASYLISGLALGPCVSFKPGSIACLGRDDDGSWLLEWMIRPELLN